MKKQLILFFLWTCASLMSVMAQSTTPAIMHMAADSSQSTAVSLPADSALYRIKLSFNTLISLHKIHILVGSTQDTGDILKMTGEFKSVSRESFLKVGSENIPFYRYTVTIPFKLHKNDKNKWKYIAAITEDVNGKMSESTYFKR
jgi:hypothetical protein